MEKTAARHLPESYYYGIWIAWYMVTESIKSTRFGNGDSADGVTPIALTGRPVTAFVGRTERGPVNKAIAVRNYNHFRQVFGGHVHFSFLSHSVQQFFLHGGKIAVVVRVVNRANRALIRVPANDEVLEVEALRPGSHEYIRVSVDYDGVENDPALFNLVVQRLSRSGSNLVEDQEIFSAVSVHQDSETYLAGALKESKLIRLRGPVPVNRPDATLPPRPGAPIPYIEIDVGGSDGAEVTDYDMIGSKHEATGLFSLDEVDQLDFLCLPPHPMQDHGITTFLAAERYCERRRALLIWDPPYEWTSLDEAVEGARNFQMRSWNALTYFPRVCSRFDRVVQPGSLPACGALAGVLSNRSAFGDWSPKVETDPLLKISLAPVVGIDEKHAATLNRFGVNALVPTQYGSAALRGNVTLAAPDSAAGPWRRLDKRRLLWFILDSIERAGSRLGDRSVQSLAEFEVVIRDFLERLRERGALMGSDHEPAYAVRSLLLAPGEAESRGQLRIGFALLKPGEFLMYDIHLTDEGCMVRSAPAMEAQQLVG